MAEIFRPLVKEAEEMIVAERAASILEIGNAEVCYGPAMADCQYRNGILHSHIDRILLTPENEGISYDVYHQVRYADSLDKLNQLPVYDFILITGLFEALMLEEAKDILAILQQKAAKQIMVITPEYAQNRKREYHPIAFLGMDFSYTTHWINGQNWQIYQFFKSVAYPPMPMDTVPRQDKTIEKMKIAFVIPHLGLTGGMKAIVAQIKRLTERGHLVKIYYKAEHTNSAIPSWGGLTKEDYAEQQVVPPSARLLDYIKEVDIIVLTWGAQMWEFSHSDIPVVMWEQGSEWLYGDYKRLISSQSRERLGSHRMYRLPIHLMCVSSTCQKVLEGVYNRKTPYCPCGMNIDFYHPAQKQAGEMPLILLVGNPSMSFKGFKFAFDTLETLWRKGVRFQVKWAAQMGVRHGEISFPLEVLVGLPQEKLAKLYASADIYFSTSLYESYPLPPLEAMASETAVVAVDNGGIHCYAKDEENCLLCPQGDIQAAVHSLERLILDEAKRDELAKAGRQTACEQSDRETIVQIEQYLSDIIASK